MKNLTTREICIISLLSALVCVFTMMFKIPVIATNGYIHLGDSIIFLSGVFFGPLYGLLAGAIGSSLADLLSGYSHWAFFTFIIKGLMGYIVGKIAYNKNTNVFGFSKLLGVLIGSIVMVGGYLIGGTILKGSFAIALTSVPSNALQAAGSTVVFFAFAYSLKKTGALRLLKNKKF